MYCHTACQFSGSLHVHLFMLRKVITYKGFMMIKVFKVCLASIAIVVGLLGLYFYFIFDNVNFIIENRLSFPVKAYITIHSYDTSKDYTYPILTKEQVAPNEKKESFYTRDESFNGTECTKILFKGVGDTKWEKSLPCPKDGDRIILNK